jgi:uncharacterized membrane protein YphA (DoxX/SURF4 family)
MRPKTRYEYTVLSVRVTLGVWFAGLGGMKAFVIGAPVFARQVAEFGILQDPWNLMVAYVVPWLEIVGGLCLAAGFLHRGAVRLMLALTLLFLFVNGQALVRGLDPDCGCFGTLFKPGLVGKLVLLGVQFLLLAFVMDSERRIGRKVFHGTRMRLPG